MSEVVQLYKCDDCGKVITDTEQGRKIQGNIYVADPTRPGGLIGNNFPDKSSFAEEEINCSVYCNPCFIKAVLPDLKIGSLR